MGIIAAMEQAQEENLGAETLEQAADQAAVVAEDRVDVVDQAADIEGDSGEVAEAVADVEELQEIGEVAEAAVESGEGLSEQAAEIATVAIERIHQRLGFSGSQRIVPAVESFGQASTRLASTKLVIESIGDTIKSVWEAIKAMAKRIWDKITQFFKKIFGSAKSLRDHLENLKKRAEKIDPSAKMKEKEFTGAIVKKVSLNKKADHSTYKTLCANAKALAGKTAALSAASSDIASDITNLTSALQKASDIKTGMTVFNNALGSSYQKVGSVTAQLAKLTGQGAAVAKTNKIKTGKKAVTSTDTYGPFVGGLALVSVKTDPAASTGGSTMISISFETIEKNEAEKAKALTKGEILEVLSEAVACCNEAENLEKTKKDIEKIVAESQKSAENVLKSVSSLSEGKIDGDQRVALNEARENISNVFSLLNMLGQKIPSVVINTAFAGADYASASIANLR